MLNGVGSKFSAVHSVNNIYIYYVMHAGLVVLVRDKKRKLYHMYIKLRFLAICILLTVINHPESDFSLKSNT